ncbi:multicopper oxidase domain-containing protein, partial [Halomonas glaciei]
MARSSIISHPLSRRQVLKGGAALGLGSAAAMGLTPAWASPWGRTNVYAQGVEEGPEISLAIRRESIPIDGQEAHPITINGTSPGPLIRLKEGQDAVLRVTNLLDESTSIHWHGL